MHSSAFGPVIQHAFVVRDMDAALTYWIEVMGVGPFYQINNATYKAALYRDTPATPGYSVALAYWDDNQIELVTPTSDNPSIYKEFLDDGHDGLLHHMCVTVKDMNEFRNGIDATKFEITGLCHGCPFHRAQSLPLQYAHDAHQTDPAKRGSRIGVAHL